MGTPPRKNDHKRAKRGEVTGWSTSATRRNLAFLRSIKETELPSEGFTAHAITLTLKTCPDTPDDWHKLRRSFLKRLERSGLLRCHWVTEWQRRGVPHLHGAVWLPDDVSPLVIIDHWLALTAEPYGAGRSAQYVLPITDAIGWFKYLAKHAARGVNHYQRSSDSIPTQWQSKTGRVWGHTGDWPTGPDIKYSLDDPGFYRLRRLCRSWRVADARTRVKDQVNKACRQNPLLRQIPPQVLVRGVKGGRVIRSARSMLQCPDEALSSVRGVSEWIPETLTEVALAWLVSDGHGVSC